LSISFLPKCVSKCTNFILLCLISKCRLRYYIHSICILFNRHSILKLNIPSNNIFSILFSLFHFSTLSVHQIAYSKTAPLTNGSILLCPTYFWPLCHSSSKSLVAFRLCGFLGQYPNICCLVNWFCYPPS